MSYVNAMVIRNPSSVMIDDVEYNVQVSEVTIESDTPMQSKRTYGGMSKSRDTTSYTATIAAFESRKAGGLAKALDDLSDVGDPVEVVVQYGSGTGSEIITFEIIPVPVSYGGEAGNWREFSQEFEVLEKPVTTYAV